MRRRAALQSCFLSRFTALLITHLMAGVASMAWSQDMDLMPTLDTDEGTPSGLEHDGNAWLTTQFFKPVGNGLSLGFAFHGRLSNNFETPRRLRGRLLAVYDTNNLRIWGGIDRIEEFNGRGTETRPWQQLNYIFEPRGRWSGDARVRLEQRFNKGVGGMTVRTRFRANAYYEIGNTGSWYVRGWNELLVMVKNRDDFPKDTFDQNRVFAGVGFRPNSRTRLEAGYQVRYFDRPGNRDRIDHILFMQMYRVF